MSVGVGMARVRLERDGRRAIGCTLLIAMPIHDFIRTARMVLSTQCDRNA